MEISPGVAPDAGKKKGLKRPLGSSSPGALEGGGRQLGMASPRPCKKAPSSAHGPAGRGAAEGGNTKNFSQMSLKAFSAKVWQKVQEKQSTTYNEVAEELVGEDDLLPNEEKNVRRRVYDALNVFLALDMVKKIKKEISLTGGGPRIEFSEVDVLERQIKEREERIKDKLVHLKDAIDQKDAFSKLINRNMCARQQQNGPDNCAVPQVEQEVTEHLHFIQNCSRVRLPYVVVNTPEASRIKCEVNDDDQEVSLTFSQPFEVLDDVEVLRRITLQPVGAAPGSQPAAGVPPVCAPATLPTCAGK
jgi:hypothetical protein